MEEAEAPAITPIPKPQKDIPINIIKPKNVKILNLKSDKNDEFEVELYVFEEYIILEGSSKKLIPQKKYKKIYSLNELQKNKFFLMYENIKEIYEEIQNQINEKEQQIQLIEEKNKLILSVPLNIKKINEFHFEIEEIVENASTQINDLFSYINKLLKDIDDLKEQNKTLEVKTKNLEEKTKTLEDKVKKQEEIRRKDEEDKKNYWKRYINSTIEIRSYLGHKNLDIEGGKENRNGIRIILSEAHGGWNQKFKLAQNEDGSISFLNGNFAIDAYGGIVKDGTQINIWEINKSNAQKFYIEYDGNDWYRINSAIDQNFCIDICSDKRNVQLQKKNESNSQKFRFIE